MSNHSIQPEEKENAKIDLVGLLHWYHDRIDKHKRSLKGALNTLYLYFAFLALSFISTTSTIINSNAPDAILLYVKLLPSAIVVIYYFKNRNKKVGNIITGSRYVELNEKQFQKIWSASYEIMRKMKLSYKLRIYYVKKDKAEANVVLEGDSIYLLLTRGMVTYSQINFKDVESIIGHELGHVCQGDSKLLLIGKSAMQIPFIVMALSWFLLQFDIFSLFEGFLQRQIDLAGTWLVPFFCWLFIVQRRESEYLADVASIIYVEDSTIDDLIKENVPQWGNLSYPSRSRRIAFIQKTIASYNKINQSFPTV